MITLRLKPDLYAAQQRAICAPERYVWIEASTKSGKTVGCLEWIVRQAQDMPAGGNAWWIAPIYQQAKIAYTRLKRGLGDCPIATARDTELCVELPGPRRIWFKGSDKPDSLYGEDVFAAVVDEASRCKEDSWHALRSTLTATRGPVRLIGNVKGRKNWFYYGCRRAEQGEDGHAYYKLTAYDAIEAGVLAAAEIEDARRLLPEHVFRELYLAEPSDDGGNPFGLAAIDACLSLLSEAEPRAFGVDLAKSHDYTVVVGLDEAGRVCRFERYQADWLQTTNQVRAAIRGVPALIDSTGVGDPIVEQLQRGSIVEGFKFTSQSKQQLMEGLASAIHQGAVRFPEGPIANELREFEYEFKPSGVRYSAPAGLFDDCVCALALAVRQLGGGHGAGALDPNAIGWADAPREAAGLFL